MGTSVGQVRVVDLPGPDLLFDMFHGYREGGEEGLWLVCFPFPFPSHFFPSFGRVNTFFVLDISFSVFFLSGILFCIFCIFAFFVFFSCLFFVWYHFVIRIFFLSCCCSSLYLIFSSRRIFLFIFFRGHFYPFLVFSISFSLEFQSLVLSSYHYLSKFPPLLPHHIRAFSTLFPTRIFMLRRGLISHANILYHSFSFTGMANTVLRHLTRMQRTLV